MPPVRLRYNFEYSYSATARKNESIHCTSISLIDVYMGACFLEGSYGNGVWS